MGSTQIIPGSKKSKFFLEQKTVKLKTLGICKICNFTKLNALN